ncbi:MAG: IS200/IS605 family transposase [Candidatus Marinimicrobia bacterium]|nr:IS200/IS605 family transposase [Candidatus Neomarinimicrobiota bacterium]
MSLHSKTRLLIHLIWNCHKHQKLINRNLSVPLNEFIRRYSQEHSIVIIASFVNGDHVHALIDLPSDQSIANIAKALKGASSRWLNQQEEQMEKFSWGRGYGAFSVSESNLNRVIRYIENQAEHHQTKSYQEEFELFIEKYGLAG